MSKRLYPPVRPQSIGEVLDTAFQILAASLFKTLPYGVLTILAGQLENIYNLTTGRPMRRFAPRDLPSAIMYAVSVIALLTLWAAMLLRQRAVAQAEPTSIRTELSRALRSLPALVPMMILNALAVFFGLVLFVVPGLYLLVALSMAVPALVLEGKGPIAAIKYSLQLVRGNWWRIAATFLVTFAIVLVFYFLVLVLAVIAVQFARGADVALVSAASTVFVVALSAFSIPCFAAMTLAVFGDLQARRAAVASGQ